MSGDSYLQPYRESVRKHGPGFKATLWASKQTQRLRFDVFTQMCFLAGKRVLDAGCSRGDFADFLLEKNIPFERYIGVDGVAEVIEHARQRHLPRCEFHIGDFRTDPALLTLGSPQVICISGTLNTMDDEHAVAVLEASWAAAGEALLFNFLSDRAGPHAWVQSGPSRRHDTLKLLDWALSKTWSVTLRQDYFEQGHDATILMRKV